MEARSSDSPLVTIVTVSFNSRETIGDTLASVADQSYPFIEHLVIDGASTDGTVELLSDTQEQRPSFQYWSEPDNGIYDAMNRGIGRASGDVIGILNSDDVFADAEVVADIVDRMWKLEASVCYSDIVFVSRDDITDIRRVWPSRSGSFRLGWVPPHPSLYLTREAYRRHGPYRTDMKISADYDLMARLFTPSSGLTSCYLPRTTVLMREGGASTKNLAGNITGFREAQISLRDQHAPHPTLTNILRLTRKLGQLVARRRYDRASEGRQHGNS